MGSGSDWARCRGGVVKGVEEWGEAIMRRGRDNAEVTINSV